MKRQAGTHSPPWRRWTLGVLLVAAVIVPLIFDIRSLDAFARAKLAVLHLFVPLAVIGPLVGFATGSLRWRGRPRWPDLAAAVFAVLAVLATVLAPSPSHALEGEPLQYQGLVTLLMYVAAYFVARVVLTDAPSLLRLFGALAIATLVVAGYGLLQQAGRDPIWHVLDKGRIFSTLGQANNLAAFLVLALPCVGAVAVTARPALRVIAAAIGVLALAALALTLSRGGYLGLLAAAVVVGVVLIPSTRIDAARARIAFAVLVVATILLVVVPSTRDQLVRVAERALSSGDFEQSSIRSHLDLWAVGWRITVDHPLLGTGPDSYVLEFPAYRDKVLAPDRAAALKKFRPESPHNVFLGISAGLGIPALAAYFGLIGLALARAVRSVRATAAAARVVGVALLGAIVGHLVSDAFMTAELTGSWLFWTFLGAAVSLPLGDATMPEPATGNREGPGRTRTPRSR